MLDKIREKKSGWLSWAFTAMIIVAFVAFFGPGSFRKTRKGCGIQAYAAKVNGRPVSIEDFNFAYMSRKREMAMRSGGKFDRSMEKALGLKQMVADELVDLELLAQTAAALGLAVAEDEVNDSIMDNPSFQNQGKFDYQLYNRVVRYHFQISPKKFEERQRARLLAQRVVEMLRGAVRMSDDEIWDDYARKNDKVNLLYVAFDPAKFKGGIKVTDDDVSRAAKDDRPKLEAYFKAHEKEYNSPKKVRARHILVKVGKDASPGEVEEAKKKAEGFIALVKGGASFEDLAKSESADPGSKDKGGDLDWFERGRMVREFDEAVFSLKKGEMTQAPVKSTFGFHVIRLDDIKEAVDVKLDDVQGEIARKMTEEERSQAAAREAAEKVVETLKTGKTLSDLFPPWVEPQPAEPGKEALQEDDKLFFKETGLFAKTGNYVPQIGQSAEIIAAAFALTPGKPSAEKPFAVAGKHFVVALKERQTPDRAKFEQEKDTFRSQIAMSKQAGIVTEWIKSLREKASVEVNHDLVSYTGTPERERIYDDM
ncbi:MAG: SurA N-terminal domain-containing protein [Deltaproteobacteria bacterium]|nr:SurA N-terminal domain-containing protein [Deltaproteobacteria bacterium]